MKRSIILILEFILIILPSHAQNSTKSDLGKGNKTRIITWNYGSLEFLKNQQFLLVTFDYYDMTVTTDFINEADFIKSKIDELNVNTPGKGDVWKEEWFSKRILNYEPKFELLFNKYAESIHLSCGQDYDNTALIMNVHTFHTNIATYVGYSLLTNSIKYVPSYINAEITFSMASTGEKVASFTMYNFVGKSIGESYAVLGRDFAKYIKKNL